MNKPLVIRGLSVEFDPDGAVLLVTKNGSEPEQFIHLYPGEVAQVVEWMERFLAEYPA